MFLAQLPPGLSPLTTEQAQQLEELMTKLTPVQKAWVSGYLAASSQGTASVAHGTAEPAQIANFTILYGSQTGNAKHLAEELAEQAASRGMNPVLVDMADYKVNRLKTEKYVAIVVSTYGEGDPPESAIKLYDYLASKKAPKLEGCKVAVLGLGDTSYEFFGQTAIDFEDRFRNLGADTLIERVLLDVDYEDHAPGWIAGALDAFEPELKAANEAIDVSDNNVVPMFHGLAPLAASAPAKYSKKNPFPAEINQVQKITGRDSIKDIRHVEISLEDSGLTYQPGDSLGVFFENDATEVDRILALLKLDADSPITLGGESGVLREALIKDLELTQSYPGFVDKYAQAAGIEALKSLAEDKAALRAYLEDRQIYDVIDEHPGTLDAQALVDSLRKLQPRLYSIASSQHEVDEEVHLTVGVVEYNAFERAHLGGASGHLGRRVGDGDSLRVYIESNDNFRLPAQDETPVIMIGPGTGIAPFRAFLQERDAEGSGGENWLFFGNPHFTQDFLYQVELLAYLKSGLLNRLDVAFSRDQEQKVYVQDRLMEKGADVFAWLERGAHFYVCGDANRMAKDVHQALIDIVKEHGKRSTEEAEAYVESLRESRRYQRDVY
ncbi:MAG: assimilatory sulfite reductase (NADPH) flavoprotein subunit [Pseudomonadota bacterium]